MNKIMTAMAVCLLWAMSVIAADPTWDEPYKSLTYGTNGIVDLKGYVVLSNGFFKGTVTGNSTYSTNAGTAAVANSGWPLQWPSSAITNAPWAPLASPTFTGVVTAPEVRVTGPLASTGTNTAPYFNGSAAALTGTASNMTAGAALAGWPLQWPSSAITNAPWLSYDMQGSALSNGIVYANAVGNLVSTIVPDIDISGYQANPNNYDAFPGLVKLTSGTMLLVYRNGTNHLDYGTIVKRTSSDYGKTWSAMSTVLTDALDLRDPSITLLQSGKVLLTFFKYHYATNDVAYGGSTGPWVSISADSGTTWGTPANIGTIVGAKVASAVSSPAVETSSNHLALAWYGNSNVNLSDVLVSHSTDGGVTWSTDSGISTGNVISEPNLLYLSGTSMLMLYRDETTTNIVKSVSADNGVTWGASTPLWFGTASPRLFKSSSGLVYCFYRALKPTGALWNKYDGSFAWRISANEGSSWGYETGFEWHGLYQVYDYASACEVAPGVIGVAYGLHYVAGPPSKMYFKTIRDGYVLPAAQLSGAKITDGNLILDMTDMRFKDSSGGYEDLISDSGRLLLRPTTTGRNGLIVYDSEQNGWISIGSPQTGTAFNNEGAIQGKDGVTVYDHVNQSYPSLRLKGGTIEIRADTVMATNSFTANKVASTGGLSMGVDKGNWKTLVESNAVYFVDTTGANVVLPSPAATSGKIVVVKLVSPATSATVSAPLFSYIDGAASYALTSPDSFVVMVCDGVNEWKIIARSKEVNSAVSVKDYGAKGDYTTDDTLSISNAMFFNRNVYFPSGTYKVSMYGATAVTGQFKLSSNHRVEMAQDAKIVVSYIPDTFDNGMSVFANDPSNLPVTNVNLINLNIETTNTITGNRGCGIMLYVPDTGGVISNKVQNVNIDNCTFKALGSAIYILQSGQNGGMTRQIKGVNITRCKSYDCWGSFVTMDGENITVSDCYANGSTDPVFINSAYDAISCHSGKGNKIVNNVFENWGNQGAIVNIRNNVNSMCGSHEITVTGNTVRSGNRTGISVTLEGVSIPYPVGEQNYGVTGVVISDNTLEGVMTAIYVDPGSSASPTPFDKVIITGNTIKTPQSGIVVYGLAAHNLYNSTISHNAIKVTANPPTYTAFYVSYLSFTSIADNNVSGYTDDSAFRAIEMGHLNYCSVTGNKVIATPVDAGYYGVYLHTTVSSTVSGNTWYTGADVTGVDALSAYTDNYSEGFTKLDGKSLLKGGAFGFNKGRFYNTDNTDPNTKVSNVYNVGDIQYLTTPQISGANAYVCTVAGSPGTHRTIGAPNVALISSNAVPLFDGYQMVNSSMSQLNTNVAFHRAPRWITGGNFANLQLKGDVSIANGFEDSLAYVRNIGVQGDDTAWSLMGIRFVQDSSLNQYLDFTTFQYGISQYHPLTLTNNQAVFNGKIYSGVNEGIDSTTSLLQPNGKVTVQVSDNGLIISNIVDQVNTSQSAMLSGTIPYTGTNGFTLYRSPMHTEGNWIMLQNPADNDTAEAEFHVVPVSGRANNYAAGIRVSRYRDLMSSYVGLNYANGAANLIASGPGSTYGAFQLMRYNGTTHSLTMSADALGLVTFSTNVAINRTMYYSPGVKFAALQVADDIALGTSQFGSGGAETRHIGIQGDDGNWALSSINFVQDGSKNQSMSFTTFKFGVSQYIPLYLNYDGNIGMGTVSPTVGYKLDVVGNLRLSGATPIIAGNSSLLLVGDPTSSYGLTLLQTGFTGIRKSPTVALDVEGAISSTEIITSRQGALANTPTLGTATGSLGASSVDGKYGIWIGHAGSGNTWIQAQRSDGNTAVYDIGIQPSGGNVGMGTLAPHTRLEVYGTSGLPTNAGTVLPYGVLRLVTGAAVASDFGNFNTAPYAAWWQAHDANSMAVNYPISLNPNGGFVGINNSAPASALDVTGSATVSGDFLAGSSGSGLVGLYDSTKYRGIYAIGSAYTMAKDGSSLANFYGLSMSYPTVTTPLAKSGLGHQLLVVENGAVTTALGTGIWTGGTVTATGDAAVTGTVTGGAIKSGGSLQVGLTTGGYVSLPGTTAVYLMNVDGANANLPDGAIGKILTIKLIAPANTGTVTPQAGYRLDGGTGAYSLTASNKFITLVSDGSTNWWNIGSN